jgi:putative DNA methylase
MGARLMAIVAEGNRGRVYLPPTAEMGVVACSAKPTWKPDLKVTTPCHEIDRLPMYGMFTWGDAFTSRQLLGLTIFSDLVQEVKARILEDSIAAGMIDDELGLENDGKESKAYAEAISVYLALIVSKTADSNNSFCPWEPVAQCSRQLFGRQAIPMLWDFAEANPLHDSSGGFVTNAEGSLRSFSCMPSTASGGFSIQQNASDSLLSKGKVVSTDPPYYDNIGYADLSDFFYIWLRRSLKVAMPDLFSTLSVPKAEELIASPSRHGSAEKAGAFFLEGMTQTMRGLAEQAHPAFPVTIYYAFKQAETENKGTSSTGWERFLEAVVCAGFCLSGTWPLRTEMTAALKSTTNSLASSIVLVCRKRPADAPTISRREFIRELNGVLPQALDEMTKGSGDERSPVAPVDLSQAIIGPGMAVFSKYSAVLEADGSSMSVRTALQLINRFLAEDDFDADTQFCLHWFEQHGWTESVFGEADVLARSKSTSVDAMKDAGVIQSGGGKVRLLKSAEFPTDWDPSTHDRLPVWEALHQLIRALKQGGERSSGALLAALGGKAESVRQLAYRLYTLCERLGQAEDARAYNELITSWTGIESAAASAPKPTDEMLPGFER